MVYTDTLEWKVTTVTMVPKNIWTFGPFCVGKHITSTTT